MAKILSICIVLLFAAGAGFGEIISITPAENLQTRDRDPLDEDACPPQTIVSIPITINGNTSASAHNFDLPCAYNIAGDDIYALSLFCDYDVTVSLCGSGYDTMLGIYAGTNYFDCPGTLIACNDDYAPCGLQSQATAHIEAGEFYFIVVSGFAGNVGAYTLNVSGTALPPDNDNCSGARLISSLPYQDFASTTCANNSFTPPCSFSSAPDVLYRLNLPCSGWMTATTCGHPLMDAILWVYKYGACPGTNFVGCNDDDCADYQSSVRFYYEANQDYYIVVDGYNTSAGYYVLHVTGESNAEACGYTYFVALPISLSADTRCSNDDYPQCNYGTASNEDVYSFDVQECTEILATLCGSDPGFDPVLEIRTGVNCPGDSLIACVDDGYCGETFTLNGTALFIANPGWSYHILVNGYYGSAGIYTLTVVPGPCELPPPDNFVVYVPPGGGPDIVAVYWDAVPYARSYSIYRVDSGSPELVLNTDQVAAYIQVAEYPPNPCTQFEITASSQPWVPLPGPALNSPSIIKPIPPVHTPQAVQLPPWVRYEYPAKPER